MKVKFKAFTLVELIVVMAIFGILMAALMNFFKPVRQTYVDSTLYDQQRSTHNGIIEYLCESTRYAETMIIYDQYTGGKVSDHRGASPNEITINNVSDAFTHFCNENGISPTDAADLKKRQNIRVLVINRSNVFDVNGDVDLSTTPEGFRGRLITNVNQKLFGSTTGWNEYGLRPGGSYGGATADSDSYMVLGGAYYGRYDYDIYIDLDKTYPSGTYDKGITFGVVTSLKNTGNVILNGGTNGGSQINMDGDNFVLKTVQGNLTRNLDDVIYYYKDKPNGSTTDTGSITGGNLNTYIIYTVPDEGDR